MVQKELYEFVLAVEVMTAMVVDEMEKLGPATDEKSLIAARGLISRKLKERGVYKRVEAARASYIKKLDVINWYRRIDAKKLKAALLADLDDVDSEAAKEKEKESMRRRGAILLAGRKK